MRLSLASILAAALLVAACDPGTAASETGDEGAQPSALVTASAWAAAGHEHDPFIAHRPVEVRCADAGWEVEADSLEVNTGECHYLVVEQPLLRAIEAGAPLCVTLWHQALYAEEPALAHAAVAIGGEVVWEREAVIPGPSNIWRDEVVAPRAFDVGERVVFHLHNHGANTWNLGSIEEVMQ